MHSVRPLKVAQGQQQRLPRGEVHVVSQTKMLHSSTAPEWVPLSGSMDLRITHCVILSSSPADPECNRSGPTRSDQSCTNHIHNRLNSPPPPNNPLRRVVQTWTRVKLTHLRPFVGFKKSRLYFGNKDNTNRPLSLCGFVVLNLKQSSSLMTKASERRSGCRASITHPVIPSEPVQGLDTRASSSGRSCCFWLRPCFSLGLIWAQRATGHNFQGNSVLSSHLTSH